MHRSIPIVIDDRERAGPVPDLLARAGIFEYGRRFQGQLHALKSGAGRAGDGGVVCWTLRTSTPVETVRTFRLAAVQGRTVADGALPRCGPGAVHRQGGVGW